MIMTKNIFNNFYPIISTNVFVLLMTYTYKKSNTTNLVLYLLIDLFGWYFILNTHLKPIGL